MTILQKWQELSRQMVTDRTLDTASWPIGYRFFREAFAVEGKDLPLLCLLEVQGHLRSVDARHLPHPVSQEAWSRITHKLLWLGWIAPGAASWGEFAYSAAGLYRQRLQLWATKEWQETETGLQPGFPSDEDMAFPMKKEVYERKLEDLSDDLQGLQLNYVVGSQFEDELEEEEKVMLEREKTFIFELQRTYETWRAYTPKYYPES